MKNIKDSVAENVAFFMKKQGMTASELQLLTNFGTNTIGMILSGKSTRGITIATLQTLSIALNVEPGDLVDDWQ